MKNRKSVHRKTLTGTVVSDNMDKVVTVRWEARKKHPVYKKYMTLYKKIKAYDDKTEAAEGDRVKIMETRPQTKTVSWKVVGILEKAQKG